MHSNVAPQLLEQGADVDVRIPFCLGIDSLGTSIGTAYMHRNHQGMHCRREG